MSRLFNNSGVTLVEVVVSALIIGIVAAPIFGSLMQIADINVKSDAELKMSNAVQEAIEKMKCGEINTFPYTAYYNRQFNYTEAEVGRYYSLTMEAENNGSLLNDVNDNEAGNTAAAAVKDMDITLKITDLTSGREVMDLKTFLQK